MAKNTVIFDFCKELNRIVLASIKAGHAVVDCTSAVEISKMMTELNAGFSKWDHISSDTKKLLARIYGKWMALVRSSWIDIKDMDQSYDAEGMFTVEQAMKFSEYLVYHQNLAEGTDPIVALGRAMVQHLVHGTWGVITHVDDEGTKGITYVLDDTDWFMDYDEDLLAEVKAQDLGYTDDTAMTGLLIDYREYITDPKEDKALARAVLRYVNEVLSRKWVIVGFEDEVSVKDVYQYVRNILDKYEDDGGGNDTLSTEDQKRLQDLYNVLPGDFLFALHASEEYHLCPSCWNNAPYCGGCEHCC